MKNTLTFNQLKKLLKESEESNHVKMSLNEIQSMINNFKSTEPIHGFYFYGEGGWDDETDEPTDNPTFKVDQALLTAALANPEMRIFVFSDEDNGPSLIGADSMEIYIKQTGAEDQDSEYEMDGANVAHAKKEWNLPVGKTWSDSVGDFEYEVTRIR